jgi:hypothetical protein
MDKGLKRQQYDHNSASSSSFEEEEVMHDE